MEGWIVNFDRMMYPLTPCNSLAACPAAGAVLCLYPCPPSSLPPPHPPCRTPPYPPACHTHPAAHTHTHTHTHTPTAAGTAPCPRSRPPSTHPAAHSPPATHTLLRTPPLLLPQEPPRVRALVHLPVAHRPQRPAAHPVLRLDAPPQSIWADDQVGGRGGGGEGLSATYGVALSGERGGVAGATSRPWHSSPGPCRPCAYALALAFAHAGLVPMPWLWPWPMPTLCPALAVALAHADPVPMPWLWFTMTLRSCP